MDPTDQFDKSTNPEFTFINLSHPDDLKNQDTIDQIRCSAMTNFGRLRRKRKPKRESNQIVFEVRPPGSVMTDPVALSRVGLESLSPFESAPYDMNPEASRLCASIFGTNCGHSTEIRQAWSAVGFQDELSYQTVLSNSALYSQMLRSGQLLTEDTTESLQLHNQALQMINQKLDDPEQQTSDSVIGSMSGFLTHDYVIGDFEGWNRHMDGLLRMIRLRGGMETLKSDLFITLVWVDICGSFSQDIPPHFPLPASWLRAINIPISGSSSGASAVRLQNSLTFIWKQELPDAPDWINIFDRLLHLSADPERPWNTWMEPILYQLLALRPLRADVAPTRPIIIEDVCRIGTLLALAPMWRTFGIHPVRTDALRQNLLSILTKYFAEWGQVRPLLLWVLMHATREAETEAERNEFGMRLEMVMGKMGVVGWDGLITVINQVIRFVDGQEQDPMWDGVKDMLGNPLIGIPSGSGTYTQSPGYATPSDVEEGSVSRAQGKQPMTTEQITRAFNQGTRRRTFEDSE